MWLPPNQYSYPVVHRFGIGNYEARRDSLGIVLEGDDHGRITFDWMA